jgi:hypothetical protein
LQRSKAWGKLLWVKKFPPKPPSRNSIFLWHFAFLDRKTKCQRHIEVFGKGFGENLFTKRFSPSYFLESERV